MAKPLANGANGAKQRIWENENSGESGKDLANELFRLFQLDLFLIFVFRYSWIWRSVLP